jgi:hypothetical protein
VRWTGATGQVGATTRIGSRGAVGRGCTWFDGAFVVTRECSECNGVEVRMLQLLRTGTYRTYLTYRT